MKVREIISALQQLDPETPLGPHDDPVLIAKAETERAEHVARPYPRHWPRHAFQAAPGEDPDADDALCQATIDTATHEEHGFSMTTQCRFAKKAHHWKGH